MDVATKLPTMDDGALATMHANAERLMQTGTAVQQSAAALMPSIKAELATRNAAKRSKTKVKPPITEGATHAKPAEAAAEH